MSKPKKTVWLHISMDVGHDYDVDDNGQTLDDEALMDIIHEELVEQGFVIDDMGIMDKEDKQ